MKKLITLGMVMVLVASLAGCKKEEPTGYYVYDMDQLVAITNERDALIIEKENRIAELELTLKGQMSTEVVVPSIDIIQDGTGRLTMRSDNDGKIEMPIPLEYPSSQQPPAGSSVNLTRELSINPTNSWVIKIEGTTMELYHPYGIQGTIKLGRINTLYPVADLQDFVLFPFFAELPPSNVEYSKLYIDQVWVGTQANTETVINEKPSMLRCGMAALGERSFVYYFVYNGEKDETKEELEVTLLRTIKLYDNILRVEG